jgi:hypothetical protein
MLTRKEEVMDPARGWAAFVKEGSTSSVTRTVRWGRMAK